jgi:hypothetical protein
MIARSAVVYSEVPNKSGYGALIICILSRSNNVGKVTVLLCSATTMSHRNLSNLLAECTETENDEVLHPSPLSATKFEVKNRLENEK